MKKLSILALCIAFSLTFVQAASANDDSEIIEPDPGLKGSLQNLLGRSCYSDEPITIGDIKGMTGRLYVPDIHVESLECLKYAVGLDEILLIGTGLKDASVLSGLKNLRALTLNRNELTSLPSLKGMEKLEYLSIADNSISDISGVTDAINLEYIHAENNDLTILPNLAGMDELVYLFLMGNDISLIEATEGLPKLEKIDLWGNKIADISPLSGIEGLKELNLDDNEITSLEGQSIFNSLEILTLTGNNIQDLSIPDRFPSLRKIDLTNCGIEKLDGFLDHLALELLGLLYNEITDISSIAEIPETSPLTEVGLEFNKIRDISSLKDFDFPFVIYLNGNPVDWENENNLKIINRMLDKYPNAKYFYDLPEEHSSRSESKKLSSQDEIVSETDDEKAFSSVSFWIYAGVLLCFAILIIVLFVIT